MMAREEKQQLHVRLRDQETAKKQLQERLQRVQRELEQLRKKDLETEQLRTQLQQKAGRSTTACQDCFVQLLGPYGVVFIGGFTGAAHHWSTTWSPFCAGAQTSPSSRKFCPLKPVASTQLFSFSGIREKKMKR